MAVKIISISRNKRCYIKLQRNGEMDEEVKISAKKSSAISIHAADSHYVLRIFHCASANGDEKQLYRLVWDESGLQLYRHRKLHRDFRG